MSALRVIDTGEVVEQMTEVEAERITARIADKLDGIADHLEQVMPLIREALTREAWRPLGYASATAYVSERFAGALQRLPAQVRRPVVAELSAAGMSTRAIAPVVGVTQKTVVKDAQVIPRVSPGPDSSPDAPTPVNVDARTDKIHDEPTPATVTGLDGKRYPRPAPAEPQKARAEAITSQFTSAIADLNRAVNRFKRIQSSPNFQANASQVATLHGSDLERAISELSEVAESLK